MSVRTMAELRAARAAAGLVQQNLWIHRDDLAAFREAVAPFRRDGIERVPGSAGAAPAPTAAVPQPSAQIAQPRCFQHAPPMSQAACFQASEAALVPMVRLCRVRFVGHIWPVELQARMQPPTWNYDDGSDLWIGRWPGGAGPEALQLIEDLRACQAAVVSVQG